ncbi:hypothetical protein OHS33_37100 [Streptomyces sp. NBC_00536]|uniref:hypothetical protein n=1 Tax=Streptomyces sp. NBC_00536 TaxID=2975769 RepID=UPI002E820736|nr:hypothetical protein [Streptomyces sp. NBC_00536]WUC83483.1 hypothetical protein OHS33_37100 [Streptomyces sp. NBC_00536]
MANSINGARTWAALLNPAPEVLHGLRTGRCVWAACGWSWDAVAIAPLQRGLEALDALPLPLDAGYTVIADHARQELIVYIPCGTGGALDALQGVRVLGRGTELLVPASRYGTFTAAWLSCTHDDEEDHLIDPAQLQTALLAVDTRHLTQTDTAEHAFAE